MRAITISRPGGPEVLVPTTVPDPVPGPDEVLIRVRATALNRADLLQRRGFYPAPPGAPPDIPGLEFAGEIIDGGRLVRSLRPGDRVMGILGGGGYAERVVLHERLCLRIPPAMSWIDAAAVPESFLTAHDALFRQALLTAGETLMIHAAGSGVGVAAAQLGIRAGAFVIGLSRTRDKRDRLSDLGIEQIIDSSRPAEVASALRRIAPGGADVVLDLIGASMLESTIDALAERGRCVILGLMGGARAELDLGKLLSRRLTIMGTVLRSRPIEERIDLTRDFARRSLPLLASGRLRPVVDQVFDLQDAATAHETMERNENFGKIVLTVGSSKP